jgi:hypothetical protein
MMGKLKKHFLYYLSLLLILIFGFSLSFLVYPDLALGFLIISITIVFYIVLGIIHHWANHELSAKIMIEYVLIGVLGLGIIFLVLKGALGI